MEKDELIQLVAHRLRDIIESEQWFAQIEAETAPQRGRTADIPYTIEDLTKVGINCLRTGVRNNIFRRRPVILHSLGKLVHDPSCGVAFKPTFSFRKDALAGELKPVNETVTFWKTYVDKFGKLEDATLEKTVVAHLHNLEQCGKLKPPWDPSKDPLKLAFNLVSTTWEAIYSFVCYRKKATVSGLGEFEYDQVAGVRYTPDPILAETARVAAEQDVSPAGQIKFIGVELLSSDSRQADELKEILENLPAELLALGLNEETRTAVEQYFKKSHGIA